MKWMIPVVLLAVLSPLFSFGADKTDKDKKDEKPAPAQSIDELRQQLEKILKDTHTPGVSVAIVHRDGPEWVAGLGKADVASARPTTADTLFRIGSTSKAFTSLSILMLADQGKLSLDDPVHKLAPDAWFENPWESTDPVRVVNLLEHTTGWDDMHLREYAKQAPDSMTLREGLDYDHHSRISRWRPGTRMAYCNSGPPVAAYIVEKLTGQRFEDYVQQNLFGPIGMKTATYFQPTPAAGDHALSQRWQDSLPVLAHSSAPGGIDQCFRQRHGGVCEVLSESRRGGRETDCARCRHRSHGDPEEHLGSERWNESRIWPE